LFVDDTGAIIAQMRLLHDISSRFEACTCGHTPQEHLWGRCGVEGCNCHGGWFGWREAVATMLIYGPIIIIAVWLILALFRQTNLMRAE